MEEDTSPKGFWKKIGGACLSPVTSFSKMTKESPAMTLIAILLVVQPVVQTGIELVRGLMAVKQSLDPATRPVTKAELDIVNQKIDFNNQLLLADIQADKEKTLAFSQRRHEHEEEKKKLDPVGGYQDIQKKLDTVQKKLDDKFVQSKK